MPRYLISFDAHAMDHIPEEDMPAVIVRKACTFAATRQNRPYPGFLRRQRYDQEKLPRNRLRGAKSRSLFAA